MHRRLRIPRRYFAQWMAYHSMDFWITCGNVSPGMALFSSLFGKWCFNLKCSLSLASHVMGTDLASKTYRTHTHTHTPLTAFVDVHWTLCYVCSFGTDFQKLKTITDSKCAVMRITLSTKTLAHEQWSKFNWI